LPGVCATAALLKTYQAESMKYSIGTLVSDLDQYRAMRASFEAHGFGSQDCEYLHIDNTQFNRADAFAGLNRLLHEARGQYVVLCHQDVRLLADGRTELDGRLAELERLDPCWALAGNAGGEGPGRLALRISDPHGTDRFVGRLPARVYTLDENFIVVKRSARIGFSRDLNGFHFYGADICLVADLLGYSAYVIDFHLKHLSGGTASAEFFASRNAFQAKWSHAMRSRSLQTTCALVPIAGNRIDQAVRTVAAPLLKKFNRVRGANHPNSKVDD
jgi:hypothetical protein